MREMIVALIIAVATQEGVPPNFVLAIALTENPTLNPSAVSGRNSDGSYDLGVMQLNSKYYSGINWQDPETNIRIGVRLIRMLLEHPSVNTYWGCAVAYNAGISRLEHPPFSSSDYATRVMLLYTDLSGGYVNPVVQRRGRRFI